jgi:hypothetical protein
LVALEPAEIDRPGIPGVCAVEDVRRSP